MEEVIEVQGDGWSYKTDFEGLSAREGSSRAEDIYDILHESGVCADSGGTVYRLVKTEA